MINKYPNDFTDIKGNKLTAKKLRFILINTPGYNKDGLLTENQQMKTVAALSGLKQYKLLDGNINLNHATKEEINSMVKRYSQSTNSDTFGQVIFEKDIESGENIQNYSVFFTVAVLITFVLALFFLLSKKNKNK